MTVVKSQCRHGWFLAENKSSGFNFMSISV